MTDFLVIGVICIILGLAISYMIKCKKKGVVCIGCPDAEVCAGKCAGNCSQCPGCQTNTKA